MKNNIKVLIVFAGILFILNGLINWIVLGRIFNAMEIVAVIMIVISVGAVSVTVLCPKPLQFLRQDHSPA